MRQPGTPPQCYVNAYANPDDALTVFGRIRRGTAKSQLTETGGISISTFTSEKGESCAGFIKYGPQSGGGHMYNARGWLCSANGAPLRPADLQSFTQAVVINAQ
jgi:hypothetical protein